MTTVVIQVRTEQNTASDRRVYRLAARRDNPLSAISAVRGMRSPHSVQPTRTEPEFPFQGVPLYHPPRSVPHDDSRS
jgi:hypothetical protein